MHSSYGCSYLTPSARARTDCRAAALELLKSGWPQGGTPRFDPDHAVVLCKLHKFQPGMLLLYERLKLYHEVLRCYMEAEDYRGLIVNAARLGHHDPNLWLEVLSYLAARQQDCSAEVRGRPERPRGLG